MCEDQIRPLLIKIWAFWQRFSSKTGSEIAWMSKNTTISSCLLETKGPNFKQIYEN
jgi:hypothetical protein